MSWQLSRDDTLNFRWMVQKQEMMGACAFLLCPRKELTKFCGYLARCIQFISFHGVSLILFLPRSTYFKDNHNVPPHPPLTNHNPVFSKRNETKQNKTKQNKQCGQLSSLFTPSPTLEEKKGKVEKERESPSNNNPHSRTP